jgi:hypothetical protein
MPGEKISYLFNFSEQSENSNMQRRSTTRVYSAMKKVSLSL